MTTFSLNDQFNLVKVTLAEQQSLTETDNIQQEAMDESAKSPDFFQNNKLSERKYMTTRIKLRYFLSNISYVGIIRKISTKKNSFLKFICWLRKI